MAVSVCEENPKWRVVTDVLTEIEEANGADSSTGRVLIVVNSTHTCNQLRHYLLRGSAAVLTKLLRKLDQPKQVIYRSPSPSV